MIMHDSTAFMKLSARVHVMQTFAQGKGFAESLVRHGTQPHPGRAPARGSDQRQGREVHRWGVLRGACAHQPESQHNRHTLRFARALQQAHCAPTRAFASLSHASVFCCAEARDEWQQVGVPRREAEAQVPASSGKARSAVCAGPVVETTLRLALAPRGTYHALRVTQPRGRAPRDGATTHPKTGHRARTSA